jgi:hypothetical protein
MRLYYNLRGKKERKGGNISDMTCRRNIYEFCTICTGTNTNKRIKDQPRRVLYCFSPGIETFTTYESKTKFLTDYVDKNDCVIPVISQRLLHSFSLNVFSGEFYSYLQIGEFQKGG